MCIRDRFLRSGASSRVARCWELARGWREVATTAFFVIFSVLASNYELWRPRLLHAQASVLQAASPPIVFTMGDKHLTPLGTGAASVSKALGNLLKQFAALFACLPVLIRFDFSKEAHHVQ